EASMMDEATTAFETRQEITRSVWRALDLSPKPTPEHILIPRGPSLQQETIYKQDTPVLDIVHTHLQTHITVHTAVPSERAK
ncbi:hypothetical protein, partial [Salmonella enterica]|uniref:hypothetical protein n=1 Tax=Salmonella enterica TaxID=28901 RepID=UPI0020C2D4BB